MKNLAKEFNFLQAVLPNEPIGIAITKNPKKSFFQQLSLIFNKSAFDTEISYFLLGKEEIKIVHYLDGNLGKSIEIPKEKIQTIYVSKGITQEGNINTLNVEIEEILKTKILGKGEEEKKVIAKTKKHFYSLLPAFLGDQAGRIYSIPTIEAAKEYIHLIEEDLKKLNQ